MYTAHWKGKVLMKLWQPFAVSVCLLFLAVVPAYCQQGTFGIDVGSTSDKFGDLARNSAVEADIEGQFVVYHSKDAQRGTNVVAGGELRFPFDTNNHATEYALFVGPIFRVGGNFSFGFHIQPKEIVLPSSLVNGIAFNRYNMRLLELPLVLEYKFGSEHHAFIQAQVTPEFTPHFINPASGPTPYPHPSFDHGYALRGVAGYNFGRWYVKATYENRYFKFDPTLGNPDGLYNWRTNLATAGVGISF